jgi:hypothetical protein
MCTLTIIPRDDGYHLAMNRDEQLSRGEAASPTRLNLGDVHTQGNQGSMAAAPQHAVYPRDGAGGTWIAANDHGIALALLNWNDVAQPRTEKTRSRGELIPSLIRLGSYQEIQAALRAPALQDIRPFRLVGVFPAEKAIGEWRWNQEKLDSQSRDWKPRHWFSSSLSDEQATEQRGAVCQIAWSESDAGSLPWLRRLHASHDSGPGPFSLCVHRENVKTLSYTEVGCGPEKIVCNYFSGSPCSMGRFERSLVVERNGSIVR